MPLPFNIAKTNAICTSPRLQELTMNMMLTAVLLETMMTLFMGTSYLIEYSSGMTVALFLTYAMNISSTGMQTR